MNESNIPLDFVHCVKVLFYLISSNLLINSQYNGRVPGVFDWHIIESLIDGFYVTFKCI